ncbi:sugar isomerase (SIS) [Solidesulfovibrio carbinoliphilus subsp. oakridgensis]|uniref:Phosphoheptose isomerase n=1 Tax=Solidesulfovibrio carbinoliphilus subsp. oakridgensis TaxID=694327 RepID=G7Q7T7_9BACT|nr:D-sedoheptulose 7-phosphate isomerase [Solidesulfovibrio carbinoliphilus]EHJ47396.1 sugar isomerase (SIS) [Solidesulfovibrio carbinoliphilus subsp. oakridgensis]
MSESTMRLIAAYTEEACALRSRFFTENAALVDTVARTMAVALARGGKILFCGNGGSAADAQHLAAEFVNRFELERPPLPALALTTDSSILTAIGNDYGFDLIFAKQVQALGQPGDVVVGLSTSGNSPNVLAALAAAREKGCATVGLAGRNGAIVPLCDMALLVPHDRTAFIQEVHIAIGHLLCKLTDHYLFEAVMELGPDLEER